MDIKNRIVIHAIQFVDWRSVDIVSTSVAEHFGIKWWVPSSISYRVNRKQSCPKHGVLIGHFVTIANHNKVYTVIGLFLAHFLKAITYVVASTPWRLTPCRPQLACHMRVTFTRKLLIISVYLWSSRPRNNVITYTLITTCDHVVPPRHLVVTRCNDEKAL